MRLTNDIRDIRVCTQLCGNCELRFLKFYNVMLATCNAQEQPQGFVRILILLFKLMMAYQAETC